MTTFDYWMVGIGISGLVVTLSALFGYVLLLLAWLSR